MSNIKIFLIIINVVFVSINIFIAGQKLTAKPKLETKPEPRKELKTPSTPDIQEYLFGHKSYEEIISTFKEWDAKAPELVEIGTYGKSTQNKDLYYLKISNEYKPSDKTVLITACIHGNEPWSTSTVMAYAGKLLSSYNKDPELTKLINERTIYIVPVVSPDSYPSSRSVDGVDPNRNFPTLKNPTKESVAPVKCLQDLFLKIKPNSVLAGHTYGRIFLIPWGDSNENNPNLQDYKRIASKMCELSGYRYQRACEMYSRPIFGTEIDWYHRNGAFAMVMEFGSHQRKPTLEETKKEFNKTFESVVCFIKESTEIDIKQTQGGL